MKKLLNEIVLIWEVFDKKQRWQVIRLLIMTVIGAFLELMGVSAIMPVVQVISNPKTIQTNTLLKWAYDLLGQESYIPLLLVLLGFMILVYVAKNSFLLILYNAQYKFTYESQRTIEGRLLSCYMKQKYSFHREKNSAELQRNILQDVVGFFYSVLSFLQLFTECCVILALFLYLFYVDKSIIIGMTGLMSLFVLIYFGLLRKMIQRIGVESRNASAKRVQWVQQSLGGIKEIKILGREAYFLHSYDENSAIYADRQRKSQMSSIAPRPIMETLGICSLLGVVAVKILRGADANYFMATLSVFAVAAFRMLPSFGRISGSLGTILFQHPAVLEVCNDLKEVDILNAQVKEHEKTQITFTEAVHVNGLSFHYPDSDQLVLDNIDLTIKKNQSVAFVGPSGAGKTTLADIILGILEPTGGTVRIDNANLFEHLDAWHEKIGYIPQSIYLIDDTIRKNIAFGIPDEEIDDARIESILKEAQLYEFVHELEHGADTFIGEGGVRLSGGQRQRIGIARALYSDPEMLVLDEATSALDNETEKAIMEAIHMLQGSKTLLIIAHRLTTIQDCDVIFEIKDGKVNQRSYEEISG